MWRAGAGVATEGHPYRVIFLSPLDLIIADGWLFRAADSSLVDYAE